MKNKRFLFAILGLLLSIVGLFYCRIPLAKGFGPFLARKDPLEKCEVIFAPSSRLETNFDYAVSLFKEGRADRLVVTTGMASPVTKRFLENYGLADFSEEAIVRHVFQRNGLPLERLTILEGSTSSFTDCNLLYAHWKDHPFRSLIIVTDAPHARRFRMVLDKVFRDADIKVVSQTSFPDASLEDLFADEEDYALFVFWEYLKIVAYAMKYAF